jgi:hypothetical protein
MRRTVYSIEKEIEQVRRVLRPKQRDTVEVEVSYKLIVDWTKVSQVGFERSIIRSEVNV